MTQPTPHFELRRVYDDGSEGEPMLFPLHELPNALSSSRRGFLAGGVAAGMILGNMPQRASAAGAAAKGLPRAHNGAIVSLSVSANGEYLATACNGDYKLWSLVDKKIVYQEAAGGDLLQGVVIGGDDVLVAGRKSGKVNVFQGLSAPIAGATATHRGGLSAIYAVPDGKTLLTGGTSGAVAFWSLPALAPIGSLGAHSGSRVTALASAADQSQFASGDVKGGLRLWDAKTHTVAADLKGHTSWVTNLAFAPDGARLMSRGADLTMRLWQLPGGTLHKTLEDQWGKAGCMALAPNGKFLINATGSTLNVWRIPGGDNLATLAEHQARVTSIVVGPDNSWAASGDEAGVVILWDLRGRRAQSYLFDPAASDVGKVGSSYTLTDAGGRTVRYTLPCGSPIPPGAICTCNCVPGSLELVRVPVPAQPSTEVADAQLRRQEAMEQRREELERKKEEAEQRKLEAQLRKEEYEFERQERRRMRNPNYNPPTYTPPSMGGGGLICTCDLIYICHASKLLDTNPATVALAENLLLRGDSTEYLAWAESAFDRRLRERIRALRTARDVRPWPSLRANLNLLESADEVTATMAAQSLALRPFNLTADQRGEVERLLAAARCRPWQARYL